PRRQALSRAHLLGPGQRAGAGGLARPEAAAGGRHRDGAQAARRDAAVEYADAALKTQSEALTASTRKRTKAFAASGSERPAMVSMARCRSCISRSFSAMATSALLCSSVRIDSGP